MTQSVPDYISALHDFRQARRQATIQQILARLQGKSAELLAYDDVRKKLKVTGEAERGLHEIPVDAIVGSVGRYKDFTRTFLPKQDSTEERWARVKSVMTGMVGLPPIEVYKVGDAYFVRDGNHRVSIARQMNVPTIPAYVTEVKTRVPLKPDDDAEEIICKARYAEFLEQTNLDKLRPHANLLMTFCGHYRVLLEHIEVHRYFMGVDLQREISYEEAVAHWYDEVYMPVVQIIRQQGALHDFPGRTETDLYVLLAEYRAELERALGWDVAPETAVTSLSDQKGSRPQRVIARVSERLRGMIMPEELEAGPATGQWRRQRLAGRRSDHLFNDILVAMDGTQAGWAALTQALLVAQKENGRVLGLHVVADKAQIDSDAVKTISHEFQRRCQEAGTACKFAVEEGVAAARAIVQRAVWVDLVVFSLQHPPGALPLERLSSGLSTLIQRCSRPLLAVPLGITFPIDPVLLAYDGTPKGEEALFVATYLAAQWQFPLHVLAIESEKTAAVVSQHVRTYLQEHGIEATYFVKQGAVAEAILETAAAQNSNLVIMGGLQRPPVVRLVLDSKVDRVLRELRKPVLICR